MRIRSAFVLLIAGLACGSSSALAQVPPPAAPYVPQKPLPGALYRDGPSGRYLLDGTWLFRTDGGIGLAHHFQNSTSSLGWQQVGVPNAWNATDESAASFLGRAVWYRKDFSLPSAAAATWIVRFESVNYNTIVWLNGHRLGKHAGAFLPFEFALPAKYLRRGAINRLVIRVDNRRGPLDLPPGYSDPGSGIYSGGWWNYGGLLGDVYLRRVDRIDFATVQVLPHLHCAGCAAYIDFRIALRNYARSPQRVALGAHFGGRALSLGTRTIAPGASATYSRALRVARPVLWWPSSPHLYDVTLDASAGSGRGGLKRVAHYYLQSGIRSVSVSRSGQLLLNGKPLHFRGVGLQEDSPAYGSAITPQIAASYIAAARDLGATVIRSQYPLYPYLEELADRLGVMLWSEIPAYQIRVHDLVTMTPPAVAWARQNILVNGNHPSVILWSIANELSARVGPTQSFYIRAVAAAVHALDPTRPVGLAVAGVPSVGCQAGYAPLDFIGLNDYFGWYVGPNGQIADPSLLPNFLDQARACYPHKALIVSEFGAEANRDGPVEIRGTNQYQEAFLTYHLGVYASKPYLAGAIYWALEDFRVRPGWTGANPDPDPPIFQKGLLDFNGNPKPAYALVKAAYHAVQQVG